MKEQEQIFNDIAEAYKVKMQILDESGENDLEITTMPLRAETKEKKILKRGSNPGSGNSFADNTYIEKVEIDVLKKPMKAEEVRNLANRLTGGKSWDEWKGEQREAITTFFLEKARKLRNDKESAARKKADKAYKNYVTGAVKSRSLGMNNFTDEQIADLATAEQNQVMKEEHEKLNSQLEKLQNQRDAFLDELDYFTPLTALVVPLNINETNQMPLVSSGTFVGFRFNKNFSAAASTAIFATLDGRRKVEVQLSDKQVLQRVMQVSRSEAYEVSNLNMDNWDKMAPTKNRKTGYIVTGNLMQALVDTHKDPQTSGQLISYTAIDGDVKQGILMNERFKEENLKVNQPINTKFNDILNFETVMSNDKEVIVQKASAYTDVYKLSVSKSKQRGSKYFLDKDLINLIGSEFQTSGGSMINWIKGRDKLKQVLDYLSEKDRVVVLE